MHSAIPYWRLSGFYFCYFSTLGGFLPYWSLYLEDKGFNPIEIGQLSALLVGTKIIAPNIWGWIADRSGKSVKIIRIASFFAAVVFSGFLFYSRYTGIALITIGFSFFWNAALPQFEAATLFHLKEEAHRYSQIRLWGSVGFIVAVIGVGRLLDVMPLAQLPVVILALLFMIWLITLTTPEARVVHQSGDRKGVLSIIKKPEVIAFLAVYLLLQAAHGPYYVFYSIYLNEFGYSGASKGLLWALGVAAEVLLFIIMRRLLKKISLRTILLSSLLLTVLRWLLIAWGITDIVLLLSAQLLHAASFGAAHVVAIHLVHRYFGTYHQGKGQALYSSMSFGLGGMLGSLYSGYCWELIGAQYVYTLAALLSALALLIAIIWVGREKYPVLA